MLLLSFLIPLIMGVVSFVLPRRFPFRYWLLLGGMANLLSNIAIGLGWPKSADSWFEGYIALDSWGLLFLLISSIVFFFVSIYGLAYLRPHAKIETPTGKNNESVTHSRRGHQGDVLINNDHRKSTSQGIFTGCLFLLLFVMTVITSCQHLGLLWVFLDATTFASAPLIYYHRHHRSLEATWKYVIICSVGIVLALVGVFLLSAAKPESEHGKISMTLTDLRQHAQELDPSFLKVAIVFFLVGYGTKMGLAPMHTWLPDAHSEAPSMVSALFSGALLNMAFLALIRTHQIAIAANQIEFSQNLFMIFGLFSLVVALLFIIQQKDFKRLLAYSSIEHMGILALGIASSSTFATGFHALNHSLTKVSLFICAGMILTQYRYKLIFMVRGLLHNQPILGLSWFLGFLVITGVPGSGVFVGKWLIISSLFAQGFYLIGSVVLVILSLLFIGMGYLYLQMLLQPDLKEKALFKSLEDKNPNADWQNHSLMYYLPLVILSLVFVMGFYLPESIKAFFLNLSEI